MANLDALAMDPAVRSDGEWVDFTTDGLDGASIRARGFNDGYADFRNRRLRRLARAHGGQVDDIPAKLVREATIEALIAKSLVDVRGLNKANGDPVTFDEFCAALRDQPRFERLFIAVITAIQQVGEQRGEEVDAAAGN